MDVVQAEAGGRVELDDAVAVLGVFDGFHVGHQRVLAEARSVAVASGRGLVAVLVDRRSGPLLSGVDQRLELLAAAGVERTLLLPEVPGSVRAGTIIVTDGERGAPVPAEAAAAGVAVVGVPAVLGPDGAPVTVDGIRSLVAAGDVAAAADLLGRPFELRGVVEHGDARGRTLGFPTANVAVDDAMLLPANGIYAGWYLRPDGAPRATAINIGRRPTFYDENGLLLVEAFLLDFDGDLYDEPAAVRFVARLRDEVRFDGVEALIEQMHSDVATSREILGAP